MKTYNYVIVLVTALYLFPPTEAFSQGLGLGTSTPSEILHLKNEGDAAIRFQSQASGTGTQTAGPGAPGTLANDASIGTVAWSSVGSATPSDNTYATAADGTSQYLSASNLGFAIPGGATIEGIEVSVEKSRANNSVQILDPWYSEADNNGTFTFAASAGTKRVLIFVASENDNGPKSVTSVSYGGQALTNIGALQNNNNDNMDLEIWYLDEAGISAAIGSAWVITWSATGIDGQLYAAATYQYVDQSALPPAQSAINTANNSSSLQLQSALTVDEGDVAIIAAAYGNNNRPYTGPTGYSTQVSIEVNAGTDHSLAVSDKTIIASGTEQPTTTFTNGTEDHIIGGFVLESNKEVYDNSVRIIKGGTISGSDYADGATDWSTTDATVTYGSSTDLWGLTWTDADINASNFGVAISSTTVNGTAQVDDVTVTVYYSTTPAAYTNYVSGIDESDGNKYKIAGSSILGTSDFMTITSSGDIGIGTTTPGGKLDVNGTIYQRGGLLHADYVFEPDFRIESIAEHTAFMWTNKHLKAIPKAQVDENGYEVVNVGSHRRGIVEELEKAHIYISQLHKTVEGLQGELELLKQQNTQLKNEMEKYEELEGKITLLEGLMSKLQSQESK